MNLLDKITIITQLGALILLLCVCFTYLALNPMHNKALKKWDKIALFLNEKVDKINVDDKLQVTLFFKLSAKHTDGIHKFCNAFYKPFQNRDISFFYSKEELKFLNNIGK